MGFRGYRFAFHDGYTRAYPDDRTAYGQPDFPTDLITYGHTYHDIHIFSYLYTHQYRDYQTHFYSQPNTHRHAHPFPDDNRLTYYYSQSDRNANLSINLYSKRDSLDYPSTHKYKHADLFTV